MRHILHQFDSKYTRIIKVLPRWVRPVMEVASLSGFPAVTLTIAGGLGVAGILLRDMTLLQVSGIIFVTHGIGSFLKIVFRRTRPATYVHRGWTMKTHSFPSGHAVGAMVTYGALASIVSVAGFQLVAVCLAIWIFLVGVSRVYIGAHYPTDVVVGWLLGMFGLMFVVVTVHGI
jgi:undecaprenyl-diphosphatase